MATTTAPAPDPAAAPAKSEGAASATPAVAAPATAPAPAASLVDESSFGSLVDLIGKPASEPAKPVPATPDKPATLSPVAEPAVEPPAKPALPATPADEDDSHGFKTPAALRTEFYARSKALKEREAELARVRSELEQAKAPREDDEKKAMAERLTKAEQELSKREIELRHANYLKSAEYREKFEKPFNDTLAEAYAAISEFSVTSEDGTSRQLTDKDFMSLLNLPRQQAWEVAGKLFGQAAPEIMGYRNKLKEITTSAQNEAKRYREQGEARDKDAMAAQTARHEGLKKHWQESNEKLAKQFPAFFALDENDPEGNEWLVKGFQHVDRIFQPNGMTPEQRIEHEADVRNRAAGFGRLAFRLKKAEAQLKERDEELAAYHESTPKRGERDSSGAPAPVEVTFDSEIDKMANGR